MKRLALLLPLMLSLAACDQLGIDTPAKVEAARAAEGKAIGSACRQSMRALEDCYAMNPKASKAAIFSGWKEMDQYMRDNNIPAIAPAAAASAASSDAAGGDDGAAPSPDKRAKTDKGGAKTDRGGDNGEKTSSK